MKKIRQRNKVFLIIIFCILLIGCTSSHLRENEDPKEKFLEIFFTTNYNNRYTNLNFNNENDLQNTDEIENDIKIFYADFEMLVTDECMSALQSNRMPYSYDKYALDNNIYFEIKKIELTKSEQNNEFYDYIVEADVKQEDEVNQVVLKGQIKVVIVNDKELIDSFYISPLSEELIQIK